ncbi:MAG: protein translocase subunit SecD [Verrucomicrobia bacterium]|nr:protein translocase subunit SecD [Verrucomicrobiota bacterium]
MNRNLFWKFSFVVFIVLWSLWEINPPQSKSLIDEFENRAASLDTNLTAIVEQARQLQSENPEREFANLREAVGTNVISGYFPFIKVENELDPTRVILSRLQRDGSGKIKLGLDLRGGTSFLVGLEISKQDTNEVDNVSDRESILSQAIEVFRRRVDRFGVAEPVIQPVGNDKILIQLPGLSESDKQSAKTQIEKAAFLEFRLVHPESDQLLQQGLTSPGYVVLQLKRKLRTGEEVIDRYLVKKNAELGLTGQYVARAGVEPDPITNQPRITLRFDGKGADLFGQITRDHVNEQLAIVLDGELYSAPNINEPIAGGSAVISGQFSLKEAFELANVLENPLQTPAAIEQEFSVEPSLGRDSIQSGIRASIIGVILVSIFMLVYYMLSGLIANVALVLNIVILMGVMCSIQTTLTLPGIAGIVLTIGMAVDANVLIFERIREEFAAGKSLRGAIASGYDKAFSTIFDSNVTTLISSVILIFMGTGPVKGFGVTLTIGVAASMFTALVVTRLIFDWMLARQMLKSLPMLRLIKETHFDFLKYSKVAFACSWALVIVGVGYGIMRGSDTLGVEFAGGDRLTLRFEQKVGMDQLREAIGALGVGDPMIQYQKDIATGDELLQVTTAFDSGEQVQSMLMTQFPNANFEVAASSNVGPSVAQEILKTAIVATLLALFGILIYVAFRYEFSFAVGAVFAVMHDVLMTMGWFCLTGRQFSAPMVAAVLTIIGFSINDTIVIFDRIREDLKLGIRGTFKDVMNQALNQTLSRTVITSGTVFLSTSALYIFGGSVINDFAFTFLVGILTGTYSSIYIASAFVLWWHKGVRPKTGSQVVMQENVVATQA